MEIDLKLSIARIQSASSRGTGFLISRQGQVLTCAHVIEDWEDIQIKLLDVNGTFTLIHTAHPIQYLAQDQGDVALLQIEESLPHHLKTLPLLSAQDSKNHPFETFGFPDMAATHGISGQGVIIDTDNRDPNGFPRIVLGHANAITEGISGAPIWDNEQKGVVGIINKIARPDKFNRGEDVAVGIPSDFIVEHFETVNLISHQSNRLTLPTEELEALIVSTNLSQAIQKTVKLAREAGNNLLIAELLVLQGKLEDTEKDFHLGILTNDQVLGRKAAIRKSLLDFFN